MIAKATEKIRGQDFLINLALSVILVWGFGIRLFDLTDPPMDFHPTRQLRGAIIARSIYYSLSPNVDAELTNQANALALDFHEFEPPVLETLVAFGYIFMGGEYVWFVRILNSLFWAIGGWAVYATSTRFTSSRAGLLALIYYLFLPFSVEASRSFQPDPFMTMWIALAVYSAFRWSEERTWKWAILTSIFSGIGVLVKVVAAYLIGGMLLGLVLGNIGFRQAVKDRQVWGMAAIMIVPPAGYYLFNIGESSSNYFQDWVIALMPLLLKAKTYIGWFKRIRGLIRVEAFLAALIGLFLADKKARWMLVGLWGGYVVYGLTLPHQIATHSYYHIQLVPIVALSLAPVAQFGLDVLEKMAVIWKRVFVLAVVGAVAFLSWKSISDLFEKDYSHEPAYWEFIGEILPDDGEVIGLVQQYGHPIMYYGMQDLSLWPVSGEQYLAEVRGNEKGDDFEAYFFKRTEGKDYFLVTATKELERQNDLNDYLYSHYSIYIEGGGYIIFDLNQGLEK